MLIGTGEDNLGLRDVQALVHGLILPGSCTQPSVPRDRLEAPLRDLDDLGRLQTFLASDHFKFYLLPLS